MGRWVCGRRRRERERERDRQMEGGRERVCARARACVTYQASAGRYGAERDAQQRLRHNMCALRRERLYAGAGGGGRGHGGGGGRELEEVSIEGDLCWNVVEVQRGLGRGQECPAGSCEVPDEQELSTPEGLLAALMATLAGLQSAGEVFDIITMGELVYERLGTQQETQQGAHRVHRLLDAVLPLLGAPASKSAPDGERENRDTGGGAGRGGGGGGGGRGGGYPEFVRRHGAGGVLVTDYLCYDALIFNNHPASGGLAADDAGIECGRSRALDRWLENRKTKTRTSGRSSSGMVEEEEEEEEDQEEEQEEDQEEEGLGIMVIERGWHLFLQRRN